uniref:Integrase, catalytic region, zinc finger, CCHC-type, peptidase aspartic, catalytic n=1 Tax=Tanacetum cinerariifolium TaxID=118510 RepID=A0A6L2LA39_TANCI|nr:hypothetical protein [Tanacetum cinerariifolium]
MFLNVEQLEKKLDKEDFQEIGSMAAFNVLKTQFQMFIMNRDYLNDEYVAMTRSYFTQYTGHAILEFRDILIQHLESVKKSIDERVHLKRDSVDTESSRIESKEHDTSSRSGNDAHDDDADIRPIYDEETLAGNQSVVRQPTAFKSERPRISKPRCDSQVDVHKDLSKPVTTHYLPKEREAAYAKPHHMIASSNSRLSSKNMPRFTSNDMVHNHYLEEAKKRTQEQQPRNSRNDSCVTKFLKEVNSRAKVPSNKTSVVQKKTMTPRSCLRWKPTGKIFKTVGLRWVPTRRILTSSTTKVDSEPLNSSNAYITNQYECAQTLDVSVDRYLINQGFKEFSSDEQEMNSDHNSLELEIHDHNNELSSSKLVPNGVPPADKTATS